MSEIQEINEQDIKPADSSTSTENSSTSGKWYVQQDIQNERVNFDFPTREEADKFAAENKRVTYIGQEYPERKGEERRMGQAMEAAYKREDATIIDKARDFLRSLVGGKK